MWHTRMELLGDIRGSGDETKEFAGLMLPREVVSRNTAEANSESGARTPIGGQTDCSLQVAALGGPLLAGVNLAGVVQGVGGLGKIY